MRLLNSVVLVLKVLFSRILTPVSLPPDVRLNYALIKALRVVDVANIDKAALIPSLRRVDFVHLEHFALSPLNGTC